MKQAIELEKTISEKKAELATMEAELDSMKDDDMVGRKALVEKLIALDMSIDDLTEELNIAKMFEVKVGDGVTRHLYTDAEACTVIARTANTITIRDDKATLNREKSHLTFTPGGFAGHTEGHQEYDYEEDVHGSVHKARWSEKRQGFVCDGKKLTLGRHKFYDYNF